MGGIRVKGLQNTQVQGSNAKFADSKGEQTSSAAKLKIVRIPDRNTGDSPTLWEYCWLLGTSAVN